MTGRPLQTRIAKLTRVTSLDGVTLHFTMPGTGRQRSAVTFVEVHHVPEFEGSEAWFEMEKVSARPWPYWRAVRRVEDPDGRACP